MPASNPAIRFNETRVLDCMEYLIANKLPTLGRVAVDRNRDPRELWQDKRHEYAEYGALVRIKLADWQHEGGGGGGGDSGKGTTGGTRRKHQEVEIIVVQTLRPEQDEEGVTIDQITAWGRHDLEWVLEPDADGLGPIHRAAVDLNGIAGPWGAAGTWIQGGLPSCHNLHLNAGLAGQMVTFPDVWTVYGASFEYDEHAPGGTPGHSA